MSNDMVGMLLALLTMCVVVVGVAMVNKSVKEQRKSCRLDDEETRLMQDMHRNLERIEQRVESLETIFLDQMHINKEPVNR